MFDFNAAVCHRIKVKSPQICLRFKFSLLHVTERLQSGAFKLHLLRFGGNILNVLDVVVIIVIRHCGVLQRGCIMKDLK